MKIQDKQFYDNDFDIDKYYEAQVKRHSLKHKKKRKIQHYLDCVEKIIDLVDNNCSMICLGTRNNHERDSFKKGLKNKDINVFSLDISPLSGADYVMDFNSFPEEWHDKWDILFSNSLDHAIDATETFEKWLNIVKTNGILIIGFDKNIGEDNVGEADCCSFDQSHVDSFMKNNNKFQYIDYVENSYVYYILRKT